MPKRLSLIIFVLASFLTSCIPTNAVASNIDILLGRQDWSVAGTDSSALNIRSEVYAEGLERPTAITHANDGSGRVFVVQQSGKIAVLENAQMTSSAFLDISDRVSFGGEQGLLSLAFHPNFKANKLFYITYTDVEGSLVLEQRRTDPLGTRVTDESEILFQLEQPGPQHNGGDIAFGPDEKLYLSLGEGQYYDAPISNSSAQDETSPYGKILVFDMTLGSEPQVFASGLRNPWRFSIDAETERLYVADVGQNAWEEVSVVSLDEPGQDLGWPSLEGPECKLEGCEDLAVKLPDLSYSHTEGCAVTGGAVYRGAALPELQGAYLYGDFCLGKIWAAAETPEGWQTTLLFETAKNISAFGLGESGELYFSDYGTGSVYKLEPQSAATN